MNNAHRYVCNESAHVSKPGLIVGHTYISGHMQVQTKTRMDQKPYLQLIVITVDHTQVKMLLLSLLLMMQYLYF